MRKEAKSKIPEDGPEVRRSAAGQGLKELLGLPADQVFELGYPSRRERSADKVAEPVVSGGVELEKVASSVQVGSGAVKVDATRAGA